MKTIKLLVALGIIGILFVSGCSDKGDQDGHAGHDHDTTVTEKDAETIWTCSMHPEIRESKPGTCPKCNMKLIQAKE